MKQSKLGNIYENTGNLNKKLSKSFKMRTFLFSLCSILFALKDIVDRRTFVEKKNPHAKTVQKIHWKLLHFHFMKVPQSETPSTLIKGFGNENIFNYFCSLMFATLNTEMSLIVCQSLYVSFLKQRTCLLIFC